MTKAPQPSLKDLEDLLTKYEDALRFYADPKTYKLQWITFGAATPIEGDLGTRARKALSNRGRPRNARKEKS